jgi:hypothetical protein
MIYLVLKAKLVSVFISVDLWLANSIRIASFKGFTFVISQPVPLRRVCPTRTGTTRNEEEKSKSRIKD